MSNTATTVNDQLTIPTGYANLDFLYGPWSSSQNLLSVLSDEFSDVPLDNFIGLTMAKYADSSNKTVQEYQLKKVGSTHVFEKKTSNVSSSNVELPIYVQDGVVKIKDGSDNNGHGVFNASVISSGSQFAPVYYSAAASSNRISKNHLYISKEDLDDWYASPYQAGNGISISGNTIGIATGSSDNGMFLKSTGNGVVWANVSSSSSPQYSGGNGINVDN